jgi:hypothetical protein
VVDGELDGSIDRAEDLPAGERHLQLEVVGCVGLDAVHGHIPHERAEPGGESVAHRHGHAAGAVQRRDPPLGEQVGVVDPVVVGIVVGIGHHGEGAAGVVAHQGARHRVGEGHAAGGLAQGGGGRQRVGVGPGVEVADAQRVEGAGDVGRADRRVLLGAPRRVHTAEGGERLGGRRPVLDGLLGQDGVHEPPPSRAFDTIMRCTSIVPDATVAACA